MSHRSRPLLLVLVLALAGAYAAAPSPPAAWSATPGGWVSGPVRYVTSLPLEAAGASDAVLHEDLLYLTGWRSFSIYDVSDPLAPQRLSTTPLGATPFAETPQTNGEILLVSRDTNYLPPNEQARGGGVLDIYDVTDPTAPALIATYESELTGTFRAHRDHLWTCVLDCAWAYSAGGTILDLRDPATPTKVGMWTDVARVDAMHHVGEVEPGIVITGSLPMYVLDARTTPAAPTVLVEFDPIAGPTGPLASEPVEVANPVANPTALPARSDWPGALTSRLAVVSMETPFSGNCSDASGGVQTFSTSGWKGTGTFTRLDRYQLTANGTYTDGAPPVNAVGCGAYGLAVHDDFGPAGGTAAVAFFEHGIRLLDVGPAGAITERGGFVPLAGNSTAPIWVTDDVLYVVDLQRGVDVLRLSDDA